MNPIVKPVLVAFYDKQWLLQHYYQDQLDEMLPKISAVAEVF